jgi:hypothetical protein
MIRKYEQIMVIEYDKARNDNIQGGYKYLIRGQAFTPYTAYKTDKGFKDWLQRSNLTLEYIETKSLEGDGETMTAKIYTASGTITDNLFWSMEELPENAIQYKGLSNGSLVDCYYIHTENGSEIFRPNPNAKEIYKPLPIDEHIEFQSING